MKTNLQNLRKAAGYNSAAAFAEKIEMSPRTYTNYEQGVSKISLELAWRLSEVLGEALGRHVSLDELAGRDFPAPEYSDPRQAELNKCWDECGDERRGRLLSIARDSAAQEKSDGAPPGRGDPVPSQAIA